MTLYILLCIVLAVIFGGAYYAYRIPFYSPNKNREAIPEVKGKEYEPFKPLFKDLFHDLQNRPCEFVTVRSHDGLSLSGRYYHQKDGAPLAIGFHGYRSSWLTDFCGGADIAFRTGQNLLLIDERAHGRSEGRTITFGILERQDVLSWARYAEQRFGADTPLFLSGISMGASTVLMAAELPLPESVVGIVADCPYSSPEAIIRRVCAQRGFPPALTMPYVHLAARVLGGFRLRACSALEAVTQAKIPILLIHGEADNFVPCDMSRAIREACASECTLLTFPGAEHGTSFLADAGRYRTALQTFMARCLETKKESC